MTINNFLIYIGSLLACSIVLFSIVKQFAQGFAGSGKKPVIYATFSSVIASAAAYGCTFIDKHLFTVFWLLSGLFLLFGIIHRLISHKQYFLSYHQDNNHVLIGELLFALSIMLFTIVVFSSLQYFLQNKDFLFYPIMMSTLVFFIPVLFMQTFRAAYDIPPPVYSTWTYPVNQIIDLPPENPRDKIVVIGFELRKKFKDTRRTYFRAKGPDNMELGQLYYFFINDYNDLHSETAIEFADKNQVADEWWFRKKTKWYQSTYVLDPSLSMNDNDIVENTVIICERIQKTV